MSQESDIAPGVTYARLLGLEDPAPPSETPHIALKITGDLTPELLEFLEEPSLKATFAGDLTPELSRIFEAPDLKLEITSDLAPELSRIVEARYTRLEAAGDLTPGSSRTLETRNLKLETGGDLTPELPVNPEAPYIELETTGGWAEIDQDLDPEPALYEPPMDDGHDKPVEEPGLLAQLLFLAIVGGLFLLLWNFFPTFTGILVFLGIAALLWIWFVHATVGLIAALGRIWRGE